MPSHNSATFVGHLGQDPEVRYTSDGDAVCNFSLAVNDPYRKDADPLWVKVTCWRKQAEAVSEYLSKGNAALVQGRVSLDEWEGKDGVWRSQIAVDAREVVFLPSGDREKSGGGRGRATAADDLPFC